MKYIFFGTHDFSLIILNALVEADYKPVLVITAPDKPKGRGRVLTRSPVKVFAEDGALIASDGVAVAAREIEAKAEKAIRETKEMLNGGTYGNTK